MPFVLLLLAAGVLTAQTVVEVSPAGDRPSPTQLCAECAALVEADGFGLEPLIRIRFNAPIVPDAYRDRIAVRWGATRQADGFTTFPENYRMPIQSLAWQADTNTLYAKPDQALDHDRDYQILLDGEVISRFHTRNVTSTILARRLGPAGSLRRVLETPIDLAALRSISLMNQTSTDAAAPLSETVFPVEPAFLTSLGLRQFVMLDFESSRGERVAVHAWIPSGPKPASGWPVKLVGHGLFDSRFSGPTLFASTFIGNSVVMAIDAVGHGYGPGSKLRLTRNDGTTLDVATNGRGRDLNGDGRIDAAEGCILVSPGNPDFIRTCLRETALDYQKLVREIQNNFDFDGDRQPDLDPNSIQYLGQSLGAMYGTILTAIEPGIDAAVLNVGGGSAVETARTSQLIRSIYQQYFSTFYPNLAQVTDPLTPRHAGAQRITGDQAAYLEVLDRLSIVEAPGAPASFAPFLKQATLYGSPIKRVLFQYAVGDQSVPNNSNGQLIRAAFEYELVSVYRHDIARRLLPSLPADPHTYMAAFARADLSTLAIALATLTQASQFLESGRRTVPDANRIVRLLFSENLFEVPRSIP